MMRRAGDVLAVLFWATALYVLVRPRSRAGELVGAVGRLGRGLVGMATDTAK